MPETFLKALESGVIGLCLVMLILTLRIILTEQRRSTPRSSIVRFAGLFMIFCLVLAALNAWVQLSESNSKKKLIAVQGDLRTLERLLDVKLKAEIENSDLPAMPRKRLRIHVGEMQRAVEHAQKEIAGR